MVTAGGPPTRLFEIAAQQGGYFTRGQAKQAGYSYQVRLTT